MKVPFVSFLPMEHELDKDIREAFERVYTRSWYIEGTEDEAFEKSFGISIDAIYKNIIDDLKNQDLLVVRAGHIFLSPKGKDVANYVMAQFLT